MFEKGVGGEGASLRGRRGCAMAVVYGADRAASSCLIISPCAAISRAWSATVVSRRCTVPSSDCNRPSTQCCSASGGLQALDSGESAPDDSRCVRDALRLAADGDSGGGGSGVGTRCFSPLASRSSRADLVLTYGPTALCSSATRERSWWTSRTSTMWRLSSASKANCTRTSAHPPVVGSAKRLRMLTISISAASVPRSAVPSCEIAASPLSHARSSSIPSVILVTLPYLSVPCVTQTDSHCHCRVGSDRSADVSSVRRGSRGGASKTPPDRCATAAPNVINSGSTPSASLCRSTSTAVRWIAPPRSVTRWAGPSAELAAGASINGSGGDARPAVAGGGLPVGSAPPGAAPSPGPADSSTAHSSAGAPLAAARSAAPSASSAASS
mmetsp:Transcript_28250/g.74098  ORF Transcript_28250/g.74098 Transcript_28250/m.74098 type:complete len:385 (-) Transcript_28250:1532-2686(-)